MIAPTGVALQFGAAFLDDSSPPTRATGLTVTYTLIRRNYDGTESAIGTGSATESTALPGTYWVTMAAGSNTAVGVYVCEFATAASAVAQQTLVSAWTVIGWVGNIDATVSSRLATAGYTAPLNGAATAAAVLDAVAADYNDAGSIGQKINAAGAAADPLLNDPADYAAGTAGYKINLIGSAEVGVSAPVAATGRVTIYQGKDYADADGTALEWTSSSTIDLTGASVTLDVDGEQFAAVVSGSAGAWAITVDLTAAETAALAVGVYPYEVVAELSPSGRTPPPLVTGTLEVRGER
ncbi:MAG: hypothetical protein L6Q98_25075 [Anaerolineae bacterium]|nr:hypothetical protein [Anaerolineae bacterium]